MKLEHDLIENLSDISSSMTYSEFQEFFKISQNILLKISQDRKLLKKMVEAVWENKNLFSECAHYESVDKLVLWNSEDQRFQLRLHIYSNHKTATLGSVQINIAEPHNHRWNFSSFILSGGYHHTLYKVDLDETLINQLTPIMSREECAGNYFTLHHSQYHSIIEKPDTVTLIFRGPLEKERFQVICKEKETFKIQQGSSLENPEEKKQKIMSQETYQSILKKLQSLQII